MFQDLYSADARVRDGTGCAGLSLILGERHLDHKLLAEPVRAPGHKGARGARKLGDKPKPPTSQETLKLDRRRRPRRCVAPAIGGGEIHAVLSLARLKADRAKARSSSVCAALGMVRMRDLPSPTVG